MFDNNGFKFKVTKPAWIFKAYNIPNLYEKLFSFQYP